MIPPSPPAPQTPGQRLRAYIRQSGQTQTQVADALNVDPTYVSQLVRDKVNWTQSRHFGALVRLLSIPEADVRELKPEAVVELAPVRKSSDTPPSQAVELLGFQMRNVYDLLSASRPLSEVEPIPDLSPIPVPNDHARPGLVLFRVRGDSMTVGAEGIHEGDIIYTDTQDRVPVPEHVYVIHIPGDGVTLKRVRSLGGELWLFSDNPDQTRHPPFRPDEASVIGRVYDVTRRPRVRL